MSQGKDQPTADDAVATLDQAMDIVVKIRRKVDDLLTPLGREMRIMKWPAEYRAILWEAVMLEAKSQWEKCGE